MSVLPITAGVVTMVTFLFGFVSELLGFPVIKNQGVAFGILIPEPFQMILIVLALAAVLYCGLRVQSSWKAFGFGLIIGGACANMLDRLIDGVVTDMFKVGSFPLFNAADAAITVGVLIVIFTKRK